MSGSVLAGIILAGGDGTRLRAYVRALVGDDRPKQFCAVLGDETLLDSTRRRTRLAIDPARLVTVVTASHERFYVPALAGVAPRTVVVQPAGRGTAPAILYGLTRLAALGHEGPVAVVPSDHYVSDDRRFMDAVAAAVDVTRDHPERVVLLGIPPDRPEVEYGWIEPAQHLGSGAHHPAHAVRRFWEKPPRMVTERLRARGALWNSFVLVGERRAFERLVAVTAPALLHAFGPLATVGGAVEEATAARAAYAAIPAVDFSREVLEAAPSALAVLRVDGVHWNDLGDPARVHETRERLGRHLATA